MAVVRFLIGLLLAVALHAGAVRVVPGFAAYVDLFLVATALAARRGHPYGGLCAGLAAGWAADALGGGPFGLYGFANSTVGYAAATAARNLVVANTGSLAALFALAALAQALLLGLVALLGVTGPVPPPLLPAAAKIATSVVLGLTWIALEARVGRHFSSRRNRPSGAIELPKGLWK